MKVEMSSDNSVSSFVSRNKTAIIATAAAGSAAIGAYYYYRQAQRAALDEDEKGAEGSESSKKKKKNKKKKSGENGGTPVYPVGQNGEPLLENIEELSQELRETYATALKDRGNEFFKKKDYEIGRAHV